MVFDGGGGLFDCRDCFSFQFVPVLISICKSYFLLFLFLFSFTLQNLISLFLLIYNPQIHQSTRSLWRQFDDGGGKGDGTCAMVDTSLASFFSCLFVWFDIFLTFCYLHLVGLLDCTLLRSWAFGTGDMTYQSMRIIFLLLLYLSFR